MKKLLLLAASALFSVNASADVETQPFIPESGFYWNPSQPGRGFAIEIQDRVLFIAMYVYSEQGSASERDPLWYTAAGTLVPQLTDSGGVTYRLQTTLDFSEGGQCLGCVHALPTTTDTERQATFTFDSPAHGFLNVAGEEIELFRFWYTASINDPVLSLLGQWTIVTDFTSVDSTIQPFEGDLLELGIQVITQGSRTAEGFRAGTDVPAAGAFDAPSQNYVIVVGEQEDEFLAYYFPAIQFGTDRFRGLAERYTPGDNLTGLGFPMHGYRISDRTFASEQQATAKTALEDGGEVTMPDRPRHAQSGKAPVDIDIESLNQTVRRLEKQVLEQLK